LGRQKKRRKKRGRLRPKKIVNLEETMALPSRRKKNKVSRKKECPRDRKGLKRETQGKPKKPRIPIYNLKNKFVSKKKKGIGRIKKE